MIFVKGYRGTSIVDRKVSPANNQRLHSTGTSERSFSTIRESERDTKSTSGWWGGRRQDNNRQGDVQRSGLRLHDNQWF